MTADGDAIDVEGPSRLEHAHQHSERWSLGHGWSARQSEISIDPRVAVLPRPRPMLAACLERAAALPCMVSSLPAARHGSQSSINMRQSSCPLLTAVSDPLSALRCIPYSTIVWTITNAQILNHG